MKRVGLALALASISSSALGDPLTDALKQAGGILCFARSYDSAWLKTHRGQTVRNVRFAITPNSFAELAPIMRMSLLGSRKPIYTYGFCEWMEGNLNRGVQGNILDDTFKPTTGVGCSMMTDTTGQSAEEGGSFPVAWGGGRYIEVHLGGQATGWHSYNVHRQVSFEDLTKADSIFRLNRAPPSACSELVTSLAPG